jgi:serpin B
MAWVLWRRVIRLLMLALLVASLAGCSWLWPEIPGDDSVAQSNLSRNLDPDVSPAEIETLTSGNAAFAFALYREVAVGDANLFFSPHSISSALAMAYAGARGATETEMAQALRFGLGQAALHPAFNALDLELNGRDEVGPPYEGDGFELEVANAVWGQRGFPFRPAYLDTLALNYGAGLRLADFEGDPDGSRRTINDWVSDQTNDRVKDLLPPGGVSKDTRLVLTNAIYFKAPWLFPFEAKDTTTEPFTPLFGSPVSVPMMHETATFSYARVGDLQAVELPYNGAKLAMLLVVPDAGQFAAFEATLDVETYLAIRDGLETHEVHLGLPRFEFDSTLSLSDPLRRALGMTDAFDPGAADFSGIDGRKDLFISDVLHKAFVSVDEKGTEAAAATAVVIGATGIPGFPVTLTIDRPFFFVIRDIPTGAVLFVGRVTEL